MVFRVHLFDQCVGQQPQNQQAGHDVHGDAVCLRRRHACVNLPLADIVHQHGAQHRRQRPRQQDSAVNRAHLVSAEQIAQIRRNGGKSATVHGNNHAEADNEQGFAAAFAQAGNQAVQNRAQHEKDGIDVFAPQFVGNGRPEKAPAHVEQAQKPHEPGRCRRTHRRVRTHRGFGKQLLNHHAGLPQNADACGDVQAQGAEEQPKLRRFHRCGRADVLRAACLSLARRRNVALRFPAFCGDADGEHAEQHEREIQHAQHHKRFRHADRMRTGKRVHQRHRQRRSQHCSAAEAHNRQTGGHAGFVGKPLHQRGHRADVAQPQAHAANHAVAQIHQPDIVDMHAECGHQKARAEAAGGHEHGFARTHALHPSAEQRGGCAEHRQGNAEHPADGGERPVFRCGMGDADELGQRRVEDGIGVNLPDGKVHCQCGRRHEPAVELHGGDGMAAVQERHGFPFAKWRLMGFYS